MRLNKRNLRRRTKKLDGFTIAAYVLFGLVLVGLGLTAAWFNGVDLWGWWRPPQSNYQKAVAEFQKAIDLEPGNPEGYRWLAKAYTLSGDKAAAEAVYRQAIDNNPDKAWALAGLGQFYLEQDRVDEAVAQFQQAVALEPDYGAAYTGLAQAYQQQGQDQEPEALLGLYQEVVADNPDQAWAYLSLGDVHLSLGDTAGAEAAYEQAALTEPDNHELFNRLGDIYRWNLNQLDQAIAHYRQATLLAPDRGWSHAALGWALYAAGQPEQGQQELEIALRLAPEFSVIQQMAGQAMLQHQSAGQAIPYFERAVEIDPSNIEARLGLTRAYRRQGELELALQQAQTAANLADTPENRGAALLEQGYIYFDQRNSDAAEAQFAQALNTAPNNPWYQAQVGNFYLNNLRQPENAADYFRRAAELAPANFWYRVFLSQAAFAAGRSEEGFTALDQALSLADEDAEIYLVLGQFLADREQWDTVVNIYEQALAQGIDDNAGIYQGLGDAYRALNAPDKAVVNYRFAANLNASSTSAP
jgi:tetratricopeptide (TPR) repeat protein